VASHQRRECRVDGALDPWCRPKAGVQIRPPGSARLEELADFAIRLNVGPPESIDRLLRVANDEQLAGPRRHAAPVGVCRIGSALKGVQRGGERLVRSPGVIARDAAPVRLFASTSRPSEIAVLREIDYPRFPAVAVRGIEALRGAHLLAQFAHEARVVKE